MKRDKAKQKRGVSMKHNHDKQSIGESVVLRTLYNLTWPLMLPSDS